MSGFVVSESGRMLDAEVVRIAEVINEYDEHLRLTWIEPENRGPEDTHPYMVVFDNPATGLTEPVFSLKETELDHRVIARLWGSDNRNGNVLDRIEAEENARKALELKRQMEEQAERAEMAAWMVKAPVGARFKAGGPRLR